jgi:hypothetical protein
MGIVTVSAQSHNLIRKLKLAECARVLEVKHFVGKNKMPRMRSPI